MTSVRLYEYSEDEICGLFRGCRNPKKQVKRIAELTTKPETQVRAILEAHGYDTQRSEREILDDNLVRLWCEGLTESQIAHNLGLTTEKASNLLDKLKRRKALPARQAHPKYK